ncbi:hypothetical protein GPZ88_10125 (plasmid) [Streptococcus ruminicola]|uniref:Uncharacterized protein n=1 Tax=Streptococcus ruminicola TaxID=2686210 RepID=A0A6G8I2N1_9STRE|nr:MULTISPECIES: hypothetical protein [Streptococcus]QGX47375.1 hypothetical protein GPA00_09580 [Streptococcus equinus]QIM47423.1 hypothetical protein GPZ88_10125 [Streptococcus ruminicola]
MDKQDNHNYSFSIPRGVYRELKYYGVPVMKAGVIVVTFLLGLQLSGTVFPTDQFFQFVLNDILMTILAFYLVLPTKAGGSNFRAIAYFHIKRKKRYFSIERGGYPVKQEEIKRRRRGKY